MSQIEKSPAVMVRIEQSLVEKVRGLNSDHIARMLMSEGWIDIAWAADHTRKSEVTK